jgi:lipopolysaccharide export system protein LptA
MTSETQKLTWGSPYLLALTSTLLATQVLVFWSKSLERVESDPFRENVDAARISEEINAGAPFLAPGVPETGLPEYFLHEFKFVSTRGSEKLWKILADRARFFVAQDFIHTLDVKAEVYSKDSPPVLIDAREGKTILASRDMELFGDVVVRFPSSLVIRAPYIKYSARERKITVPERYRVTGEGNQLKFASFGMNYFVESQEAHLQREVVVNTQDETELRSDHALIDRKQDRALFTMSTTRPEQDRFVRARQPTLTAQSRKMTLYFGPNVKAQAVTRLVAEDDVRIDESGENIGRYATAGRAEFEANSNTITLRKFPQVYQDRDTVTGEVIRMHRGTSLIEVERSNAISEGQL